MHRLHSLPAALAALLLVASPIGAQDRLERLLRVDPDRLDASRIAREFGRSTDPDHDEADLERVVTGLLARVRDPSIDRLAAIEEVVHVDLDVRPTGPEGDLGDLLPASIARSGRGDRTGLALLYLVLAEAIDLELAVVETPAGLALVSGDRTIDPTRPGPAPDARIALAPGEREHGIYLAPLSGPDLVAALLRRRAAFWTRQREAGLALADLDLALRFRPADGLALLERSRLLVAIGRLDAARTALDEAERAVPGWWAVWYESGLLDERREAFEAAIGRLEKAAALHETGPLREHLAYCADALGRADEALGHALRAVELDRTSPTAHFYLGVLYYQRKNRMRAKHQFQRTLELEPDHEKAQEYLSIVRREMGLDQ